MSGVGSANNRVGLQGTLDRVRNTVFGPKVKASLESNMAAVLPQKEKTEKSVQDVARILAVDIVHYVSEYRRGPPPNSHARTLRRTADEVLVKHEILFNSMVRRLRVDLETQAAMAGDSVDLQLKDLSISSDGDVDSGVDVEDPPSPAVKVVCEMITSVANATFSDGVYNWGRIVTLYAFGGFLAKHLVLYGLSDLLDDVASCLSDFVNERLADWIHKNGGWDEFDEFFFDRQAVENNVWKGLLLFMGVGVGALATMVAVR